ncbi:MAG: DUF2817 domain-containing protein [Candidatus Aminicenantes bacterium]|nr:DUF2817 domain-containing protein [Candidatus Aminicenantes bacterium]
MKKTLKIVLFSLLVLIAAAYLFLFFSFNGYKPSNVEYEIVPAALDYFYKTYDDCRSAFIEKANLLVSQYDEVEVFKLFVACETDPDLTVDFCYIPAQVTMENLLIISSGIHGIEGFTGSAVQLMVMEEILNPHQLDTTGIFLIHGMNPFDFKYLRRFTENDVDINRNCAVDESLFKTKNEGYERLNDMLNPQGEANYHSFRNKHFHLVAIQKTLAESVSVLRQAIVQGQYEYPQGLFFGGQELEPQIVAITPILQAMMTPYTRIITIDLHTAYGENGTMHLFPNPVEDSDVKADMEELFAGYTIDWGGSDDFYTIMGSFADYIGSLAPGKTYYSMGFEFGTLDSQKTFGSLRSLHNFILENQGFHHGYKNKKTEAKIKENFLEMHFPSNKAWRSKVIMDAKKILDLVLERLGKE